TNRFTRDSRSRNDRRRRACRLFQVPVEYRGEHVPSEVGKSWMVKCRCGRERTSQTALQAVLEFDGHERVHSKVKETLLVRWCLPGTEANHRCKLRCDVSAKQTVPFS